MTTTSKALQIAGVISLFTAGGHYVMGSQELGPKIKLLGPKSEASKALIGWYQGCFMYATFGLNYLRLAASPMSSPIDKAIVAAQFAAHLFTAYSFDDLPPRILSAIILVLGGYGTLAKLR